MRRLLLSTAAENDLIATHAFLADRDPAIADRFVDGVFRRCGQLIDSPHLGRPRPDVRADVRSLLFERWVAFYRSDPDAVLILRIVDSSRDLGRLEWPDNESS